MLRNARSIVAVFALSFLVAGCKKTADTKPNFESAIEGYYQAHPACLWPEPQKFPVQLDHDDPKTAQFDALVDQGLLARSTSEKKIIIISRRQTNYDISEKGRSVWTADSTQPGYGNFCYGHRKVASVDAYTPTSDQPGAVTTVQYKYALTGVPDWARAAETQTAYPSLAASIDQTPKSASVQLTNTTAGWQVSKAATLGGPGADSDIVH